MLQRALMFATSRYLALLARSWRPASQPHMRHFSWYTRAFSSGAPNMSQIHVVQKRKITPVQHASVVFVALPFPLHFCNRNSMQPPC